jgi:8-oxo-dGTP diphosphatase
MYMKAAVDPEDVKNLRTMEPEKLDGDWAWITWNDLTKEDSQYRPLFVPLQNLLLTRPHFKI